MADELRRAYGLTVSAARARRKMSQRQLATAAKLNRSYLSRVESGFADPPLTVQGRIASGLNLDLVRMAELTREEGRRLRREAAESVASEEAPP